MTDASSASLHAFITEHVEPGATVITDAWQGYRGLEAAGYVHDRRSQRAARAAGEDPHELLPALAVAGGPLRYRELIAARRPRGQAPRTPGGSGHPASLDRARANRPWRAADQPSSA